MYTYHYVRMHGWTGACKRHVSVYDSAYINLDYLERCARASALKKSRFVAWCLVKGHLARWCSRVNSDNRIITITGMIIGVKITYTDTTYKRLNNKVDRIGLIRWLYVHRYVFDSPSPATFDKRKQSWNRWNFNAPWLLFFVTFDYAGVNTGTAKFVASSNEAFFPRPLGIARCARLCNQSNFSSLSIFRDRSRSLNNHLRFLLF
jgi:hypothetical protein